jgi:DNA repair protein RadD
VKLRDYQSYSIKAIYDYFSKHTGNPIVALPTGTGKSVVIAEFVRGAFMTYPGTRIMMLTHVKELIEQNMKTLLALWPTAPAGIYSAGLKRRDAGMPITFAGIQSVYKKSEIFGHKDIVLIDECHLVSSEDATMYIKFIEGLLKVNPALKVIGFSATAYRLKPAGLLNEAGGLFTDFAVDLTSRDAFNWLIREGWLSPVVPKHTRSELDVSNVRIQGGEYNQTELQLAVDKESVTFAALNETIAYAGDRKHWLVFATGIDHAEHVAEALNTLGITATTVHSKLPADERDRRIRAFKAGQVRAVVNNNVLTTGFDFPSIDCIVMLRPTASPGLWVQMLGRGTRPVYAADMPLATANERRAAIASGPKQNCLVMDFAGNTTRLGPINDPVLPRKRGRGAPGVPPVHLCEVCECYSHAAARFCEHCGAEFPRRVNIFAHASEQALLVGFEPPKTEQYRVDRVTYSIGQKEGMPEYMRVDYWSGLLKFSEFVYLDHKGYANHVAKKWWQERSPWGVPPSTRDGMLATSDLKVPKRITVVLPRKRSEFAQVINYEFD